MALKRVSEFAWDGILAKTKDENVLKSINLLRNRANEITSNASRYAAAPAPIDFKAAKKNLKFTGSAIDSLVKIYEKKELPHYTASLPAFEKKRREAMIGIAASAEAAAVADLENLAAQLKLFENVRIANDTSTGDLRDRFPHVAKEVESEIDTHKWLNDSQ